MNNNNVLSYLEIELSIVRYYGKRQHIIVPNYYINFGTTKDHECDLIVVKKSGYADEIEIKMNKADLMADFKKKHKHIDERLKHLYYAMPRKLYEECKELIPDDAGVFAIYKVNNRAYAQCEKTAPNKKCRKLTLEEQLKIARSGVMKLWNIKNKQL